VIVSAPKLPFAAVIAARNVPAPESAVLVTVYVAARTPGAHATAATVATASTPANRTLRRGAAEGAAGPAITAARP
jgi:hypothetical protein